MSLGPPDSLDMIQKLSSPFNSNLSIGDFPWTIFGHNSVAHWPWKLRTHLHSIVQGRLCPSPPHALSFSLSHPEMQRAMCIKRTGATPAPSLSLSHTLSCSCSCSLRTGYSCSGGDLGRDENWISQDRSTEMPERARVCREPGRDGIVHVYICTYTRTLLGVSSSTDIVSLECSLLSYLFARCSMCMRFDAALYEKLFEGSIYT